MRAARRAMLRVGLALLLALLGLFGLDALLFRTKLYTQLVEPDSSTGQFELTLRRERKAQRQYGDNLVACLGDSRLGLLPRVAAQVAPRTGYFLRQAGVAGTDPRAWYYMLRDLDPTRRRYRAVVFAVNDYDDEDGWGIPEADLRLLHYAIARLRLSDVPGFFRAFPPGPMRWEAFRGSLLKGLVYQTDVQAFLVNPMKRIRYVRLCNQFWPLWTWNYEETPRNMVGLQIDWTNWKVVFPPGADQNQIDTVKAFLMYPVAPQTGHFAAFRRQWFGKIIDRYRGSPTKIVFVRLARGPIPRPGNLVLKKSSSIREFARRPNVLLVPEHAFDSLEHPEFYKDAMHLNREGTVRFSQMLAEEVAKLLGPPHAREAAK
ncbi:MAG: hypothetical protein ABSF98_05655 [Bryobacteraceae bacterium]